MKKVKHRYYFLNPMFIKIDSLKKELDIDDAYLKWRETINMEDLFNRDSQYLLIQRFRERGLRTISFLKEGVFVEPIHLNSPLHDFWHFHIYYTFCWWIYKLTKIIIGDFWWKEEYGNVPYSDIKVYKVKDFKNAIETEENSELSLDAV